MRKRETHTQKGKERGEQRRSIRRSNSGRSHACKQVKNVTRTMILFCERASVSCLLPRNFAKAYIGRCGSAPTSPSGNTTRTHNSALRMSRMTSLDCNGCNKTASENSSAETASERARKNYPERIARHGDARKHRSRGTIQKKERKSEREGEREMRERERERERERARSARHIQREHDSPSDATAPVPLDTLSTR